VDQVDLGTLIAFSTAPGAVALDGDGRNSPFTEALVRHLATPGLEIRQLMTRVRRSVVEATGGQQVPWDNSSLITEVVLRPGGGRAPAAPAEPAPRVAAAVPTPQPAAPRGPEPAAMPAPAAPQAVAAIRSVAARQGIPLPDPLPLPAAGRGAHPLLGIWGGEARWNRTGRAYLLIVLSVDAAARTADIILAGGAGDPRSVTMGLPPSWSRHRARLSGGTISWQDEAGDTFEARRNDFFGEVVEIVHTRSRTILGRASPQGQVGLPRLE
jgi:hypothetical protein